MYIKKFQAGGMAPEAAPVAEEAPVSAQTQPQAGAEEQLAQVAAQLVETLLQQVGDPNAVAAILQMAMEMLAEAAQGGPQEQPVFKKGGKLVKNAKCGTKMKVKK